MLAVIGINSFWLFACVGALLAYCLIRVAVDGIRAAIRRVGRGPDSQ